MNVNHTLVKDGWSWWYRKYAPGNAELEKLETEARNVQRGLWIDPQHVPPWEWRKRTRRGSQWGGSKRGINGRGIVDQHKPTTKRENHI
jgi:endonuclease YncB( thermonuclease family)